MAVVTGSAFGSASSRYQTRSEKWPLPTSARPKNDGHWPTKITRPIPAVKPRTTGLGIRRMTLPRPARPKAIWIAPAMKPARIKPSTPCFALTPARITTKVPVGPAIWKRVPPNSATIRPAITAV